MSLYEHPQIDTWLSNSEQVLDNCVVLGVDNIAESAWDTMRESIGLGYYGTNEGQQLYAKWFGQQSLLKMLQRDDAQI